MKTPKQKADEAIEIAENGMIKILKLSDAGARVLHAEPKIHNIKKKAEVARKNIRALTLIHDQAAHCLNNDLADCVDELTLSEITQVSEALLLTMDTSANLINAQQRLVHTIKTNRASIALHTRKIRAYRKQEALKAGGKLTAMLSIAAAIYPIFQWSAQGNISQALFISGGLLLTAALIQFLTPHIQKSLQRQKQKIQIGERRRNL